MGFVELIHIAKLTQIKFISNPDLFDSLLHAIVMELPRTDSAGNTDGNYISRC